MKKLILFFYILTCLACTKDVDVHDVTVIQNPPAILVESSIKGRVIDEDGKPMTALVKAYLNAQIAGTNGLFEFNQIDSPDKEVAIIVARQGFFTNSRPSNNKSGGSNYVQIQLISKGSAETFNADETSNLAFAGGAKLHFPANSVQSAPSSQVKVYAKTINAGSLNDAEKLPGAMQARDAFGNDKVLSTFGTLVLSVEDGAGYPLQLDSTKGMDVEIPIDPVQLSSAPDSIPFWWYDIGQSRWYIQGYCHKTLNGTYTCHVTNACNGYYTCALPLPAICLGGLINQADSTPAFYTKVIVEDLANHFIYYGYTDLQGLFCGSVPGGTPLKITIKDLCDNILYEENVGPFSTNTMLPIIYLSNTLSQYVVHITGTLLDDAGLPVTDGHIAVTYPGKIRAFPLGANGLIDVYFALNCITYPELTIQGFDRAHIKTTLPFKHSDTTAVVLGTISAAQIPDNYMQINIGGTEYVMMPTQYYLKQNVNTNWMVLEGKSGEGDFTFDLRTYVGAGLYQSNCFFNSTANGPASTLPFFQGLSPDFSLNITQDDGTYISGNVSGNVNSQSGLVAISGDFKVKKQ